MTFIVARRRVFIFDQNFSDTSIGTETVQIRIIKHIYYALSFPFPIHDCRRLKQFLLCLTNDDNTRQSST